MLGGGRRRKRRVVGEGCSRESEGESQDGSARLFPASQPCTSVLEGHHEPAARASGEVTPTKTQGIRARGAERRKRAVKSISRRAAGALTAGRWLGGAGACVGCGGTTR